MATLALLATVVLSAEPEPTDDILYCSVACTYVVLKETGKPATIAGITNRFRGINPEIDLERVSLQEIRQVLESFGCPARAVRGDPRMPERIQTPAILYLRPDKVGQDATGHVVVLLRASAADVEVMDATVGMGRSVVPAERLPEFWDGEMIAIGPPPSRFSRFMDLVSSYGLFLFIIAFAISYLCFRRRPNANSR